MTFCAVGLSKDYVAVKTQKLNCTQTYEFSILCNCWAQPSMHNTGKSKENQAMLGIYTVHHKDKEDECTTHLRFLGPLKSILTL